MRQYITLSMLTFVLLVTGCHSPNQYTTYGTNIVVYEGDPKYLKNCCSAAMGLLADEIKEQRGLDTPPKVEYEGTSYSENQQWLATRTIQSISLDNEVYKIEITQIKGRPATIYLEYPHNDSRLINHLLNLFSNFEVKLVDGL